MRFGVIGTGVVGTALAVKLVEAGYKCVGVNTRSPESYANFHQYLAKDHLQLEELVPEVDLLFITTQDDRIAEVVAKLQDLNVAKDGQVWIHCSGALEANVLRGEKGYPPAGKFDIRILSLHPLQAFANVETALELIKGTHFGIEGDMPELGERLVRDLGGIPHRIEGELKALYHAGAVTASNYLVTLSAMAVELLHTAGLKREEALESLLPLMEGTLKNLATTGLPDALTGPIDRGDVEVVRRHLEEMPLHLRDTYKILGQHTFKLSQEKTRNKYRIDHDQVQKQMLDLLD